MSKEASSEQKPSTTTVSSVVVQAGDASIVIAVLKCGKWVKLQLAESTPNLLEIGSNQDETKKLLQDHEFLLAKLKALEDEVWDLLHEADKAAEEDKEKSQVYDAMAETLGDAWDALIIMLEKRQALLELTSVFFENALEFAVKIDQVEDFLKTVQAFDSIDALRELLLQQDHHTKELLEKSLALLNKSQELTEFIEEFKYEGPNVIPELIQGAHSSCMKIDNLLELLQDRRRQLDRFLKHQRQVLEQLLQIYLWHHQENQVTSWYKKNIRDYFYKQNLGSSLSENEKLLQELEEMDVKMKEWSSTVEQLEAEALKILLSEDYTEKEHLKLSSQKICLLREEVFSHMEERKALLQEANDFFRAAGKVLDGLEDIENYIKIFNSEGLHLPVLTMKYKEIQEAIQVCTMSALQKGQTLVKKSDSHSTWVTGIQKMMEYIKKKVNQLPRQCPDYKELILKKQQWTASLEDHLNKVSQLIKKVTPMLVVGMEIGSYLSESERVLNKHLELAKETKEISRELEAAERIIRDIEEFEPEQVAPFSSRIDFLNEELKKIEKTICSRLEILETYVAFLKSAVEVNNDIQNLKEFYKSDPLQTNREAENKIAMEPANSQWQRAIRKIFYTQNMGCNFLDLVNMVNESLISNVEKSVQLAEDTVVNLSKEKKELTELWAIWNFKITQVKPAEQQSQIFKEQLKMTTYGLEIMQESLQFTATVDLETDLLVVLELQEKFNQMKPQCQQLNAELEYLIKLLELPSQKGFPVKENSEGVSELIRFHQTVKDKMTKYNEIFNKTVKFHHIKNELGRLSNSGELDIPEVCENPKNVHHAKAYLVNTQEKHAYIRQLYKLIITQGVDILSAVQQPNCMNVSVKNLKREIARLECDSINWSSKASKYEEELLLHFQHCTTQEEINELGETFKDLKKKFNNLKFNYIKRTEKARNVKVLKIQIQQVDTYAEKMQVLKKKLDNLEKKVIGCVENELNVKSRVLLVSISDLQKQVNDFSRVVEDYKKNLDLMEHLQQMMEECQFWFEDVSATVLRVDKYSAECQTKEAIESLYKQFNKFIEPTVPQQEERIQKIIDLAEQLYGIEEGEKHVEKAVLKYKEIIHSVDELYRSLRELKEIKKAEFSEELVPVRKEERNRQEACEAVIKEEQKQQLALDKLLRNSERFTEKRNNTLFPPNNKHERNKLADIPVICPAGEDLVSQDTELSSLAKEDSLQTEFLAEELPSGDEYECISPDDISLPPLSETPESNLLHSEAELEEQCCYSSHSLHVNSCSLQMQKTASTIKVMEASDLLTNSAYAGATNSRMERLSDHFEKFCISSTDSGQKVRTISPLTCNLQGISETSTASCTINTNPVCSVMSEVCKTHLQHLELHKSMAETQEQLHDLNNCTKTQDRLHALPDAFSGFVFQSDATRSCQRQMVTQEEIKSSSEKNSMASLTGQVPNFSQLLSNKTVMEGSPVTLEVEVTGFPEPTLTWYKKGQKLTADEHLKLFQKETKHTLFIQKVCDKDAGLYVVRAKNLNGTISSSAILHVKVQGKQPNFIQKFGHTTLQEGEDLILHCTVQGKPKPHVYWTKDNIQVVSGDISIEKLGDTYYLLKRNVVLADTGKYICVASNEIGKAHCSAFVTVIEKYKPSEISTVTQAKSEWEDGYSSGANVSTTELVQAQSTHSVGDKRLVAKHHPVRFKEKLWLQGVYLELERPLEVGFNLEQDPVLLLPAAQDQKMD
ncbi:coiled-coil domain-containing protein 141 [Indicator indicator]|uniref:coiled-coil domain-containing protein 141 n=1 Tax=Indicator indicator TaxID=1002788 RepID=UPI0023DE7B9F|nr:coiled-coil domain-containing protein 141 [Indicator indicator]